MLTIWVIGMVATWVVGSIRMGDLTNTILLSGELSWLGLVIILVIKK
jgi:hypothetical protein